MKKIIHIAILPIFILGIFAFNKSPLEIGENSKSEKINDLLSLFADYEMFNGTALVVDQGEVIFQKGFGLANMEWDIPNEVDTKFKIASLTKAFTAMLVLQMVNEGKMELQTSISKYLPNYPKENADQISIHHLLTHSAGLGKKESERDKKYNRPKDMVAQFADAPLKFVPGDRFDYSNSGYTLLGYILETVSGQSYEELLDERIFKPLGMKNSGFHWHRTLLKNQASGYTRYYDRYFNEEASDESSAYAAGAIYSTVEDMFLWDQALETEKLLPKKYMDLLFQKHIVDPSYGGYYGYGWEIMDKAVGNTSEKIETIGHSGSIGGFRSLYTKISSSGSTILLLNNTNKAYLTSITTAITGILENKTYDLPLIPLEKFTVRTIEKDGIEKGLQYYKDNKDSPKFYSKKQSLIMAGYKYLQNDNPEFALKIFKLSTEVYPEFDNAFDSYAEALLSLGKKEEAIKNYKKSLELNPNNNNALEVLKKLGVDYSVELLKTTEEWGKEFFTIPLHFAPEIKLKGREDARFPRGWNDTTSPNFWTYAFAWKVNLNKEQIVSEIEDYVRIYYDGLLSGVNKEKGLVLPETMVDFKKTGRGNFKGKATIYDTFITRRPLVLNFTIEHRLCKNGKSSLLFRISPQSFDHQVWKDLNEIKILSNICE